MTAQDDRSDLAFWLGLAIIVVSAVALLWGLVACGPAYPDPLAAESDNPACGTDALAKLIAGRARDMSEACRPSPVAKCSPLLKDPVNAKWKPRFDEWEKCE